MEKQIEKLRTRIRAFDAFIAHDLGNDIDVQGQRIEARKALRKLESESERAQEIRAMNAKTFGATLERFGAHRLSNDDFDNIATSAYEYGEIAECVLQQTLWVHLGFHATNEGTAFVVECSHLLESCFCNDQAELSTYSENFVFETQSDAKAFMIALLMIERDC